MKTSTKQNGFRLFTIGITFILLLGLGYIAGRMVNRSSSGSPAESTIDHLPFTISENGAINGFARTIHLEDPGHDYTGSDENPWHTGGHLIENMNISHAMYRRIRIEGNGNIVRNNVFRFIGGSKMFDRVYVHGIESYGPGAVIQDNIFYKIRGTRPNDIDEGVGIALPRQSKGSIVTGNLIVNSSIEPTDKYRWAGESRSTWGIWIGSFGEVVVSDNQINNFVFGIEPISDAAGLLADNVITGAIVPILNTANAADFNNICDLDEYNNFTDSFHPREEIEATTDD